MYEFGLKYAKLQKSGLLDTMVLVTTMFGTGTKHILYGGTGTTFLGTGTKWVLHGGTVTTLFWYQYHLMVLPRNATFWPLLIPISSYNFSIP